MPAAYTCVPAPDPAPEPGRCQVGYVEAAPTMAMVAEVPPADVSAGAFAIGFVAAISAPRALSMVIREVARLLRD